jgi:hypothetical protein
MPTSVHIPAPLLRAADARAKRLGISRNRLIVDALALALEAGSAWPAGFAEELLNVPEGVASAARDLEREVLARRKSKAPVRL